MTKIRKYELEKQKLIQKNLPYAEFQKELKKLIKKLKYNKGR